MPAAGSQVPVWSPVAATRSRDRADRSAPMRPRSALLVALLAFYVLQLAAALLAWREAPIRTEALLDPIRAWALCSVAVLPALMLRGRWRALPAAAATALGTATPILLSRDLIEVVGPRDVWVGQSLTLQVLFPLLVGSAATLAVLTAPRREPRTRTPQQ